jgi:hypothetical protein
MWTSISFHFLATGIPCLLLPFFVHQRIFEAGILDAELNYCHCLAPAFSVPPDMLQQQYETTRSPFCSEIMIQFCILTITLAAPGKY